jgi:hypothetical protein
MIKLFLKRAAAGIATAGLTGTFAAIIIRFYGLSTGAPTGPSFDGETLIALATIYGAIIGGPFGIIVFCLSRAKASPWRAFPIVLTGTSLGIAVLGLPWALLQETTARENILVPMCIAGPIIGGLVATALIPSQESTSLER